MQVGDSGQADLYWLLCLGLDPDLSKVPFIYHRVSLSVSLSHHPTNSFLQCQTVLVVPLLVVVKFL